MSFQSKEPADRMALFERRCRERGLAMTVQRRVVLEVVLARGDHPTAEQIYEDVKLRIPDISRTTVYRVLDTLVDIGVIGKPSHFGAATRYEPNVHRHHHLICIECGRVSDVEDDETVADIEPLMRKQAGDFAVLDYSIHFHGVCSACAAQARRGDI
ncbi:MAG TPA: Fur family transcriptional regulator [Phycisphaerae bacterium]|nr:Fur family transcriptional regulator [Phycisphaerae bacterium]